MLFKDSEIESLHICKEVAVKLNNFYIKDFSTNKLYSDGSQNYINLKNIFFGLRDVLIKIDDFLLQNDYVPIEFVHNYEANLKSLSRYYLGSDIVRSFLTGSKLFLQKFNDIKEYEGQFYDDISLILKYIDQVVGSQNTAYPILKDGNGSYKDEKGFYRNDRGFVVSDKTKNRNNVIYESEISNSIKELKSTYSEIFEKSNNDFKSSYEAKLNEFDNTLIDSHNEFKTKSDTLLQKFNDEINSLKLSFKKDVEDEVSKFKLNFTKVDTDFKNSVKDFEILKKFINAKGEKEITDHYKNKAKWERVTYWVMTFITFGIIILSVCMALKGLDEYKLKANISVETLLEKYKDQPVEKIEKIYGAVQSSALTYLVLRLIFSVLLFSSIIYTSRVAYRAYIHMRHSENMMLKLATLRPFINQLDESERNQIHKDLVPDYFGKDAGLVDGASEKFKDLPANVSAVAMKAIEQIGGSPNANNSKAPDAKDAKTAGE